MKLKNDWWGHSRQYGWSVMIDIVDEHRHGGQAVFYSFLKDCNFNFPFRDLEDNDITFASRYFKKLPEIERGLARAKYEECKESWPEVQAKRIADEKKQLEIEIERLELLRVQQELEARQAVVERQALHEQAQDRERIRVQNIKIERASLAIQHLTQNGIEHLWHFTSRSNLEEILRSQCLYGKSVNPNLDRVRFLSDELSRDLDKFTRRDNLVRLSFIPNSWFFHRVRNTQDIIWLRFSLELLKTEAVHFVKGNGASTNVPVTDDISSLSMDWSTMRRFKGPYTDEIGPRTYRSHYKDEGEDAAAFREEGATWNSEVMVENSLRLTYCDRVYDARTGAIILQSSV